jgi:hypothetical protein
MFAQQGEHHGRSHHDLLLLDDGFLCPRFVVEVRTFGVTPSVELVRISRAQGCTSSFEKPPSLFLLYRLHSSCIRTQPFRLLMRETVLECKPFGDSLPVSATWLVRSLTTILSARYRKRHADQDRIYDLEGNIVPASSIIVAKY